MTEKIYFSATTLGFYLESSRALFKKSGKWPADLIEITEEKRSELLAGNGNGYIISADSSGHPILTPPPEPTVDDLIADAEIQRSALLEHADSVMLDWRTELMLGSISDENKAKLNEWLEYKKDVKAVDVSTAYLWPTLPL